MSTEVNKQLRSVVTRNVEVTKQGGVIGQVELRKAQEVGNETDY
jgi:hypothetical protein